MGNFSRDSRQGGGSRPRSRERNVSSESSRGVSRRGGGLNLGGPVGNGGGYVDGPMFDASRIGEGLGDAMRNSAQVFNNCFCWNCGYAAKVASLTPCPRCGAMRNGPGRFLSPCMPQPYVRATARHPSILRYKRNMIVGGLIFAILFSIGLCIFMFTSGDLEFDDEGIHNMSLILTVIWLFWIVWIVYDFGSTRKKINCDNPSNRRANYCGLCGCIIPK